MTVNMLIQIDKLVQLLESPVFTCKAISPFKDETSNFWLVDLRLQLLEPEKYPHLYRCLYGLLMLLPQSSAFAALKNRLQSVSAIGYLHIVPRTYVSFSILSHSILVTILWLKRSPAFHFLLVYIVLRTLMHDHTAPQLLQHLRAMIGQIDLKVAMRVYDGRSSWKNFEASRKRHGGHSGQEKSTMTLGLVPSQ